MKKILQSMFGGVFALVDDLKNNSLISEFVSIDNLAYIGAAADRQNIRHDFLRLFKDMKTANIEARQKFNI